MNEPSEGKVYEPVSVITHIVYTVISTPLKGVSLPLQCKEIRNGEKWLGVEEVGSQVSYLKKFKGSCFIFTTMRLGRDGGENLKDLHLFGAKQMVSFV